MISSELTTESLQQHFVAQKPVKLADEFSYIYSRITNRYKQEKPGKLTDGNIYSVKN